MSLKLRLSRHGAKKRPFYHIVVADSHAPRDGRFIEKLGYYNPMVAKDHPQRISLNAERITHWLSVGAQASDRVARFLSDAKLAAAYKVTETPKKSQPKAKAQERIKEQADREAAAIKAAEDAKAAEARAAQEAKAAAEAAAAPVEAVAEEATPAATEEPQAEQQ